MEFPRASTPLAELLRAEGGALLAHASVSAMAAAPMDRQFAVAARDGEASDECTAFVFALTVRLVGNVLEAFCSCSGHCLLSIVVVEGRYSERVPLVLLVLPL